MIVNALCKARCVRHRLRSDRVSLATGSSEQARPTPVALSGEAPHARTLCAARKAWPWRALGPLKRLCLGLRN
jgi:hypothetical protein